MNAKKYAGAVALVAVAGVAHAQGAVTLYGILDAGATYSNNNGKGVGGLWQLQDGQLQGSRWGLLGSEDLGNGMRAIFQLENGFSVLNGALSKNLEFGRQGYMGLSGTYGQITVGRQYSSTTDYLSPLTASNQWSTFLAAHLGDVDNINGTYRINNSIKYTSPDMHGLQFGGLFSLGGVAGNFGTQRVYTAGLRYKYASLTIAAAYQNVNNPSAAIFYGTQPTTGSTTYSNPISNVAYSGFASANRYKSAGIGGAYAFGKVTLGLVYTNTQFSDPVVTSATPRGVGATFNIIEANLRYQITPAWSLGSSYIYSKTSTAHYNQLALGADYFLSKRTDLYAVSVFQAAAGIDSTGSRAVANISGLSASGTSRQLAWHIGIRHRF